MADIIDINFTNVRKDCIACGTSMMTSRDYTPCCILCREKGLYTKEDINADEARLEAAIETIEQLVRERDAALHRTADLTGYINRMSAMIPGEGLLAVKIQQLIARAEAAEERARDAERKLAKRTAWDE